MAGIKSPGQKSKPCRVVYRFLGKAAILRGDHAEKHWE